MRTGSPIPPLVLTDDDRDTLLRWTRNATSAQVLAQRPRIVLQCASGASNTPAPPLSGLLHRRCAPSRGTPSRSCGILDRFLSGKAAEIATVTRQENEPKWWPQGDLDGPASFFRLPVAGVAMAT